MNLPLDTLIEGNCLEILPTLPAASVDMVFADPPYNLQLKQDLWRPNLTRVDAVKDEWDQFESFAEYDAFTRRWLEGCLHVLKDTGTLWVIGTYHNIFRVGAIMQDMGFWILNTVVWIKLNPMPNFRGVRFTNAHETLIWAQKQAGALSTFNHHAMKALNDDLQMRSDWYLPLCNGRERLKINGIKAHTTQKPEALLYRVLLSSTKPGDIILDPFFGTGTTGAVAKKLHRRWIGIEKDQQYVSLARERIRAVEPGSEDQSIYETPNPRRAQRIPFGSLLENGLLKPGQSLFFGAHSEVRATIRADGQIECDGRRGSIHQVARALQEGPCNGWQQWYYFDEQTLEKQPIDRLRQQIRAQVETQEEEIE